MWDATGRGAVVVLLKFIARPAGSSPRLRGRGYDRDEPAGRGTERTRVSSTTENMPCHWSWIEIAAASRRANRSGDSAEKRHRITPEPAGSPTAKSQLTEVLVERQNQPLLRCRLRQDLPVVRTGACHSNPDNIVARRLERGDRDSWNVLVGEESHGSDGERKDPFGLENFGRIVQTGYDVVVRQIGIILQDLLLRPALAE
jgi:hypothetical protein